LRIFGALFFPETASALGQDWTFKRSSCNILHLRSGMVGFRMVLVPLAHVLSICHGTERHRIGNKTCAALWKKRRRMVTADKSETEGAMAHS
jgi:hypothetical protein